ncbi:MAG: hypothetical protein O9322_06215 [Beijerinckiaceae bacterium]|nr:hypothetical protein [Beijerinckiaceae bacterium]MCZ8299117.1 hypothetical protein [Beijerinckiaceae bacterium]
MNVLLGINLPDSGAWLDTLVSSLRVFGHDVATEIVPASAAPQPKPDWLLRLEPHLYGVDSGAWLAPSRQGTQPPADASGRLRIALSPAPETDAGFKVTIEDEALALLPLRLAQGLTPRLIVSGPNGKRWMALPATERPFSVAFTLDSYIQRLGWLIHKAAIGHEPVEIPVTEVRRPHSPASVAGKHFVAKALGLAARRHFRPDHWHVGIRRRRQEETGLPRTSEGCTWIADDGQSYLADPILWEENGRAFLFVEVFPFSTMTGFLAVTELDGEAKPLGPLRPVLTRKGHLSYPFLFRHDGQTYMIPENAAEGHLPLYRAVDFPDRWEECAPLLDVPLQDATLFAHGGKFWLLGNESRSGSSWDCLCAYHADSPLGPFLPHAQNPLLIDARFARSAGPVFRHGEDLIRPVQDCLGGYGRGVHFMRIIRLDQHGFRQERVSSLFPEENGSVSGIHTYCRSSRFEAFDALTPASRKPA